MRDRHRRLTIETLDKRLMLTGTSAAFGPVPAPSPEVPAEIATVAEDPVANQTRDGKLPATDVTRTVTETGFTIEVRLNFPDVAVAPNLEVAPGDPTSDKPAPT